MNETCNVTDHGCDSTRHRIVDGDAPGCVRPLSCRKSSRLWTHWSGSFETQKTDTTAQGTTWSFNCASPSRLCPVAAMKTVLGRSGMFTVAWTVPGVAKSVFTFYENYSVHIPEIVADCFFAKKQTRELTQASTEYATLPPFIADVHVDFR